MQYHTYWGSDEETLENYEEYLSREQTDDPEEQAGVDEREVKK